MSANKYPHLFEPIIVANTVFRNRIFASPTGSSYVDIQELPMPEIAAYYERKAIGGAASVAMGERAVDNKRGLNYGGNPIPVGDHRGTSFFRYVTNAISRHGAIASIELQHGGCYAKRGADMGNQIYGPVEGYYDGVHVLPMTEEILAETIDSYAAAAKWAKAAGFGMVTIHGGHGWLLTQFMSSKFNTRTDRWGGSTENRVRLAREVCKAIKKACGPNFVVEMRISGSEGFEGGYDIDEGVELAKALDGYPDIIHVSAGHGYLDEVFTVTHPPMFAEHGVNVRYAAAIKPHIKQSKVSTVGALSDPELMEEIIASGKADIVNMARGLIADPDLPNKARTGNTHEVNKCLRCFHCFSNLMNFGQYSCAINPEIGREEEYSTEPRKAEKKKDVLVLGGGIGGMQAAITAAKRGHNVTLYEKTDRLGGVLLCEEKVPFKKNLHDYIQQQIRRLGESGAKVVMNTELTPEEAEALKPDVIIAAIGAKSVIPNIPGIDGKNVMGAEEAYVSPEKVGEKVAILGGGLVGSELGIYLAGLGKKVQIIEMADKLNCGDNFIQGMSIDVEIKKLGIGVNTGCKAKSIDETGVVCEKADGEIKIDADTVIYAVGMKGKQEEAKAFALSAPIFYQIGDCLFPKNIYEANRLGYNAAMDIGQYW